MEEEKEEEEEQEEEVEEKEEEEEEEEQEEEEKEEEEKEVEMWNSFTSKLLFFHLLSSVCGLLYSDWWGIYVSWIW